MNYDELKKAGIKFYEEDNRDGGIYLGTNEYWVVGNDIYVHEIHTNTNRYTGKTNTYFYKTADKFFHNEEAEKALIKTINEKN